jgi:alkanesulfonate monooxygenase SsuD/methylene tetrahydromethanopterin reductase-like flavin-dependent oxidoreductase (luciferase family)
LTDDEADQLFASPAGEQIKQMMTYAAVGTPDDVHAYVAEFVEHARADELIVIHPAQTLEARLRSMELLSEGSRVKPNEVEARASSVA